MFRDIKFLMISKDYLPVGFICGEWENSPERYSLLAEAMIA
jgi:hypothetical protein